MVKGVVASAFAISLGNCIRKDGDNTLNILLVCGGMKRILMGVALLSASAGACAAEPVGAAIDRPAQAVRAPERAVLLGAAQAGAAWVAVGERGLVLRSEDGGARWQQVAAPVSVTLTSVRFANERQGIAVGHGGTV